MPKTQRISHRQLQKEETRRIILDSAYSLFAEKGYAKTTMRALAEHAGIGLGTIFKHFPDKSSLLVAAFQEDLNRIIRDAFVTLPAVGLEAQLLHLTEGIYSFYAGNPRFSRTLIAEVLFMEGEYGDTLYSQVNLFLHEVALLIQGAAERGEIPADIDPGDGALAFWSFYFTVLLMGLKQSPFDMEGQMRIMRRLIRNHFYRR